jgi:hypothetical protein
MPTVYTLERVGDIADIVRVRKDALKSGREELLEAIREARQDGHTLADIGRAIGTSRQYIHLLLKGSDTKERSA